MCPPHTGRHKPSHNHGKHSIYLACAACMSSASARWSAASCSWKRSRYAPTRTAVASSSSCGRVRNCQGAVCGRGLRVAAKAQTFCIAAVPRARAASAAAASAPLLRRHQAARRRQSEDCSRRRRQRRAVGVLLPPARRGGTLQALPKGLWFKKQPSLQWCAAQTFNAAHNGRQCLDCAGVRTCRAASMQRASSSMPSASWRSSLRRAQISWNLLAA